MRQMRKLRVTHPSPRAGHVVKVKTTEPETAEGHVSATIS